MISRPARHPEDAPHKTGVGRFFELLGRDMNGMFLANLLACLGFLPGDLPGLHRFFDEQPARYAGQRRRGRHPGRAYPGRGLRHGAARPADEPGYWWTTYRRAFRQNFKASILPGILYCVVVTVQIFMVYFCFQMLAQGVNVGTGVWVATVLNLVIFHMMFAYMWPQVVLLEQPLRQTWPTASGVCWPFCPMRWQPPSCRWCSGAS